MIIVHHLGSSAARGIVKYDYKKVYELHFTLHANPPTKTTLPARVYSNLKSLSFSSQLTASDTYDTETICNDLQRICSSAVLSNIKRIYLYDQVYPQDFRNYSLLSVEKPRRRIRSVSF